MKKTTSDNITYNSNSIDNKNLDLTDIKTTDINILLNRVRLDKKKDFNKKIIYLSFLITIIGAALTFSLI